jgi:hypothetical protein
VTTPHDFGGVLGQPWTFSFGLSQFHGHGSWLMCEVALIGIISLVLTQNRPLGRKGKG